MQLLTNNLRSSILAKEKLLKDHVQIQVFELIVGKVISVYRNGGRLYIAGNGGSAADAQHLAAEFVSKLAMPRAALPAEALTVDTSIITAIGNDYGFEHIFARQIEAKVSEKDIFLGITTSGHSRNILEALRVCGKKNIPSVIFTGRDGGLVKDRANYCIIAPGEETSTIQEVHQVLCHTLCGAVEALVFPLK